MIPPRLIADQREMERQEKRKQDFKIKREDAMKE